MQNRIDRLEGLVLSLMTNGAQSAGPAAAAAALSASASNGSVEYIDAEDDDMIKEEGEGGESETEQVARSFGVMRVDNEKSMYVGDAHWVAILSDVGSHLF